MSLPAHANVSASTEYANVLCYGRYRSRHHRVVLPPIGASTSSLHAALHSELLHIEKTAITVPSQSSRSSRAFYARLLCHIVQPLSRTQFFFRVRGDEIDLLVVSQPRRGPSQGRPAVKNSQAGTLWWPLKLDLPLTAETSSLRDMSSTLRHPPTEGFANLLGSAHCRSLDKAPFRMCRPPILQLQRHSVPRGIPEARHMPPSAIGLCCTSALLATSRRIIVA